MNGSFHIVKVFGFDIRAHFSWVFIFLLIAWSVATRVLPAEFPGWTPGTYWTVGVISSLLLFVCVLIHELSHSIVARSRGHQVRSITLFFLGGVSEIEDESDTAGEEFWISVVGPLTSLALAAFFWLILAMPIAGEGSAVRAMAWYLAIINLMLGVFNLIPAYPMDGGRVLKSLVWRATGSQVRATATAATTGMLLGFAMIGLGILLAFYGNLISGLWLVFIGWFIQSTASASRRQQVTSNVLRGRTVREAMDEKPVMVEPGLTVQELMDRYIMLEFQRAYLVSLGANFQGLVSITDVKRVDPEQRSSKFITEIMTRSAGVVSVTPEEPLEAALQKLVANDLNQLVVLQEGRAVGLLSRGDVLRVMEVAELLPSSASPRRQRPPGQ